jgi:hypothetical protein
MLAKPETSVAAAADEPDGTMTLWPSTTTATLGRRPSGPDRNIEVFGRKQIERRVERAFGDHRRQESGVRCNKSDIAVAIGSEGPGTLG